MKYIVKFEGMEGKGIVCPSFLELKGQYGCPFRCEYCYLRGTLQLVELNTGRRMITFEDYLKRLPVLEKELEEFFRINKEFQVLNCGELAEPLMFERTGVPFSKFICPIFESQNTHKVLFLTKSDYIDNFLKIDPHKQTIVSFSINASEISKLYEIGAPDPISRIQAARKVKEADYEVRIRIDPLMPFDGWQEGYAQIIHILLENLTPDRITLGVLRINNARLWKFKFWQEKKPLMEYIGKSMWRMNRGISAEMYRYAINQLKSLGYSQIAICKETPEMWRELGLDSNNCKCNCVW